MPVPIAVGRHPWTIALVVLSGANVSSARTGSSRRTARLDSVWSLLGLP
jgi:hypothetical protein